VEKENQQSDFLDFSFLADPIFSGVLAFVGLFLAYLGFRQQSEATKIQILKGILLKINELKVPIVKNTQRRTRKVIKDFDLENFLNHVEILAVFYNENKIHRRLCRLIYKDEFLEICEIGIIHEKIFKNQNKNIYSDIKKMYCELQRECPIIHVKDMILSIPFVGSVLSRSI
jgi:predicted transposase YbfD/YdcC